MDKTEVRIVDGADKEIFKFCYTDGSTKYEYLNHVKQEIIQVLLALAANYTNLSVDDVVDHLECVEETQYLFSIEVFAYLNSQIDFFKQEEWNNIIGVTKIFIDLLKPGWWDEIRSTSHQEWQELRQNANELLTRLNIQYQDSVDYVDQHMHFDILRVVC
ncbi:hypothetical protein [Hymenobacter guriensis]|uniref:Uncharacterized protein n=1 Tax=Hymenobacter guriensis TaxID=2793065 RepID=A0ABS0L638_9BACT|nr:hypothetical protein [Hymenobacter guriensis]MBG8555596.1 hypothetical protein [Hymenobacter guriensis]